MSERESTASNIATDLLGRLNNKLRSELVRHVDEYFQKLIFKTVWLSQMSMNLILSMGSTKTQEILKQLKI